ncbi:hypothetical protein TWF730_003749 [Orbilia blumenaviensis]|uniref:catechol O-methyltransferase n=1 Tax=Orbilia blumenaviensis TaxID=1796055 RepID=A0AAV9U3T2_9PEZI
MAGSGKYVAKDEGTFYDDGREEECLEFVQSKPNLQGKPDAVLEAIDEFGRTRKYLMNIGVEKGKIVRDVIANEQPTTMVELGGYCGYSAIAFAAEMKRHSGGRAVRYYSLERNATFGKIIEAMANLAGLGDIIRVVVGDSSDSLRRLQTTFNIEKIDILFLDHHKPSYAPDLRLCETLRLVVPGSVIVADNVIYPGNPPYLEYVRSSCEEKRQRVRSAEENELERANGRWDLVYESNLVESFEPTGETDGVEISRITGWYSDKK